MSVATSLSNPIIEQRADPWIWKHSDGFYYFTASVPEYDRIELRRSQTIQGLEEAVPVTVWRKPDVGPMSNLIWAPELHFIDGKWYVYFAAAHTKEIINGLFDHRMFVIECASENPLEGEWVEKGKIETDLDTFSLDATTFEHKGVRYLVWPQKDPEIKGNSNLYIAKMKNPWTIEGPQIMLSKPELHWEIRGFWVNEGPAVIKRNGKIFITYSASATDENYCMGLLTAADDANLLDPQSWTKSDLPVFETNFEERQYGPGHNSFTVAEDGTTDILVYHSRTYTEIIGDPLYDPNRHTRAQSFRWKSNGEPDFGVPVPDARPIRSPRKTI